jgi:MoxR-like ATPase
MIVKAKSLLIVVTLLCLSIFDTEFTIVQFHSDTEKTEKTVEFASEENEKKFKDKKTAQDDFKTNVFAFFSIKDNTNLYVYLQKKHTFKTFVTPFRPPITS